MKVLLLGADGFIGRHIAFGLRAAGHDVVASARRTSRLARMGFEVLHADLAKAETHDPAFWEARTTGITHVVNAAGVLNGSEAMMRAVHVDAPHALYAALPKATPILLLSAIAIDGGDSLFAKMRIEGEAEVHQAGGMALRPGLVLADTSYGGSSLGRALAALPWVTPVIDGGRQQINPIHADDLTEAIIALLADPLPSATLEIGGPEVITQGEMLGEYRRWLGLAPAREMRLPASVARFVGRVGDMLRFGPISATFVAMLEAGALAKTSPDIPTHPRGFSQFVWHRPAGTQDLWQARLYLLGPLSRLALAALWLGSGLVGLLTPADVLGALDVTQTLGAQAALVLARGGGVIDLVIGWAVLRGWHPKGWGIAQLAMVAGYTAVLSGVEPKLWALPYGGLIKNLPIAALILIHMALSEER